MDSQILFSGIVLDTDDPSMLNRARVHSQQKDDVNSLLEKFKTTIIKKYPNINPEQIFEIRPNGEKDIAKKFRFTKEDPFVYRPFLPFHLKFVPKQNELVLLIFWNKDENNSRINQFYIPGILKSPMNVEYENYKQSVGTLSQGILLKPSKVLKNFLGKFINQSASTVWAKPEDNAIYGRGSTDLILKKDDLILRAGKVSNMNSQTSPKPNKNLGFFQITYLPKEIDGGIGNSYTVDEIPDTPIAKLLEYDITDGLDNSSGFFSGSVNLYNLPQTASVSQKLFNFSSKTPENVTAPLLSFNFQNLNFSGVTELINKVVKGLTNNESIKFGEGIPDWSPDGLMFPFFFRPSQNLRDVLNITPNTQTSPQDMLKWQNTTKIYQTITAASSQKTPGYGLVSEKGKLGAFFQKKKKSYTSSVISKKSKSYSILGSDKILLLSYNDSVKLENNDTYGLNSKKIAQLKANTQSTVRGENLYEFLSLLYQYLVTHVHAVPESKPIVGGDVKNNLDTAYANFHTKVLNKDIRIS
jgi:hypothetical protein